MDLVIVYLLFYMPTNVFSVEKRSKFSRATYFPLRTFARNFSNIEFFLKILPLKDDELAMSEM